MRHQFDDSSIRGQFAGHETFPLRLLWLKKAHDAVRGGAPLGTFQEPQAIARFGVGRNMAQAMRYWSLAAGFITEDAEGIKPTEIAKCLLDDDGLDPFVERLATIWLAHWKIASTPAMTTTAYYAFNALSGLEFDAAGLGRELLALVEAKGWRATAGTLKRDIEVFVRSYARRGGAALEDAAEPLLAELGLVRETRAGGWFEFVRGPKPSLPDGVFAYALAQFWRPDEAGATALTAEHVCYGPGSPGRVFKLDEDSVVTRLMGMERFTDGAWRWTDTAGLRQIQRVESVDPLKFVLRAYPTLKPAKDAA
ncbi:DUF4007 family protein [Caulobacter sp. Root342]|uniref:DUF4007 family protein n=1 Tax=Caulobacter sp. Root342 TaxID=1736519 RepID=UPI0006F60ADF|nr:DUF4007 family protein [Caulobacter sp. Root342]KQV54664.1 hypothetical protein ASC62_23015 [Caulobacter sp. Root342]